MVSFIDAFPFINANFSTDLKTPFEVRKLPSLGTLSSCLVHYNIACFIQHNLEGVLLGWEKILL